MVGIMVPGFLQPAIIWFVKRYRRFSCCCSSTARSAPIGPLVLLFVFVLLLGSHVATTLMLFETCS